MITSIWDLIIPLINLILNELVKTIHTLTAEPEVTTRRCIQPTTTQSAKIFTIPKKSSKWRLFRSKRVVHLTLCSKTQHTGKEELQLSNIALVTSRDSRPKRNREKERKMQQQEKSSWLLVQVQITLLFTFTQQDARSEGELYLSSCKGPAGASEYYTTGMLVTWVCLQHSTDTHTSTLFYNWRWITTTRMFK